MTDGPQEGVPLSHALGIGTLGQMLGAQPSLKALAARVLEGARESVPLSHAIESGTVGQAVAGSARAESERAGEWDAEDWQAHFDERAGIAEFDGGQTRADAEANANAFECAVVRWMNRNPPADADEDHCAACGRALGRIGEDAVPVLAGEGRHAWVHHGCHGRLMAARRAAAITALAALGLTPPEGWRL